MRRTARVFVEYKIVAALSGPSRRQVSNTPELKSFEFKQLPFSVLVSGSNRTRSLLAPGKEIGVCSEILLSYG